MSTKRKILLISLGSIGRRHLRNTREMLPDATIAVYQQYTKTDGVIPEEANLVFESLDDAVAYTPDAVIISSPASEHVACAKPFLKTGAHIFLEKPLADKSTDLEEFRLLAKTSSSFLMIGYVLRFLPALHYVRKLIADDVLGKVFTANVEVGQYLPDWRPESDYRKGVSAQESLGGGCLLELSHELDYAIWLFGAPDKVLCSSARISDLDIDVEDSALVVMEYGEVRQEKRVVVQVDFLQRVANMYIEIVGSKGTLKANLITEEIKFHTPENPEGVTLDSPKLTHGNEIYLRQFDFFFTQSFTDYTPRYAETIGFNQWAKIDQAIIVMNLVDLAKKSNNEGQRMPLLRSSQ